MGEGTGRASSQRQYRLDYFMKKHGLTAALSREILAQAGDSRSRANAAAEQYRGLPHPSLTGEIVLVVEDDYFLASETVSTLLSAGAEVLGPFENEGRAFDRLLQVRPTTAVLDICLAGELTFELARVLQLADVPFIFVSGYDKTVVPDDLACVPHVLKPIRPEELVQHIRALD